MLKEPSGAELPARATEVTDRDERARVYSAPETRWCREHAGTLDALVDGGPLARVVLTGGGAASPG